MSLKKVKYIAIDYKTFKRTLMLIKIVKFK